MSAQSLHKPPLSQLLSSPLVWVAIGILVVVSLLAIAEPFFGYDPSTIYVNAPTAGPLSHGFLLGTDDLGRDLLARIAVGAQISLSLGLLTALVSVGFGSAYGLLAGLKEGTWDLLLMRWIDVLYSLPGLMVVILIAVFLEPFLQSFISFLGFRSAFCLGPPSLPDIGSGVF